MLAAMFMERQVTLRMIIRAPYRAGCVLSHMWRGGFVRSWNQTAFGRGDVGAVSVAGDARNMRPGARRDEAALDSQR